MAKTPTKTSRPNAPRATAAPAKKVETPAQATKPETQAPASAPAANPAPSGTGLEPDTTSQGQADMQGKDTSTAQSTDAATAAAGTAAVGATLTPEAQAQADKEAEAAATAGADLHAIKEEAYREGYSAGFSAALDDLATDPGNTLEADAPEGFGEQDPGAGQNVAGRGFDRTALIALALYTPENQRKGGLAPVVDRLEKFMDTLDPDDRWPALQFMHTIAQTKPLDLANGRFSMVITESLKALNGAGPLSNETAADRGEAAAARFAEAFQQEDESEPALDEDAMPHVDPDDPDSGAAAAARLGAL